ncbi:MAG TPA: hypothetical protein VHQ91_11215, partial [Geminicoccaceae bacterium]|nr:hypothetical protein [Geminicoccaceae bacterium]
AAVGASSSASDGAGGGAAGPAVAGAALADHGAVSAGAAGLPAAVGIGAPTARGLPAGAAGRADVSGCSGRKRIRDARAASATDRPRFAGAAGPDGRAGIELPPSPVLGPWILQEAIVSSILGSLVGMGGNVSAAGRSSAHPAQYSLGVGRAASAAATEAARICAVRARAAAAAFSAGAR